MNHAPSSGLRREALRRQGLTAAAGLDIAGTATFGLGHDLAVPAGPGVYVISDLRGPLYVGQTTALRRRYGQHYRQSHNALLRLALSAPAGAVTFSWVTCQPEKLNEVERAFIRGLQPICNHQNVTWII